MIPPLIVNEKFPAPSTWLLRASEVGVLAVQETMPRVLITNLTHLLDDQGRIAFERGPARRLADFITNIVATMTYDFDSPLGQIHCRRRPNRKPCPGLLEATFTAEDGIAWRCPQCGDAGLITHWQNTFWDMTDAPVMEPSSR